jgi:DNA-binding NarL/FixJ family response regulator
MNLSVQRGVSIANAPGTARPATAKPRRADQLAVIDARNLARECFVRSMELSHPRLSVKGYPTVGDWKDEADARSSPLAVLFNIGGRLVSDPAVAAELRQLVGEALPTPVIVLAESEDLREMIEAVDCGAGGYIPASVGMEVVVEATRLTAVGGMFLPVTSIPSLRNTLVPKQPEANGLGDQFTSRQAAVANALRRGKANKIIAYELNLSESTVKVHIRNIMKKLKATNRTEAAFKLNAMFPRDAASG